MPLSDFAAWLPSVVSGQPPRNRGLVDRINTLEPTLAQLGIAFSNPLNLEVSPQGDVIQPPPMRFSRNGDLSLANLGEFIGPTADMGDSVALMEAIEKRQPIEGSLAALSLALPFMGGMVKAYHGSPHIFDEFDASKIGTGEGAQAYGHGLYFAEDPKVAGHYRQGGSQYDVELDVDPEDLLDYDLPLDEQPEKIRQALSPYVRRYEGAPETALRDFLETDYAKAFPNVRDVKWARAILEDPDYDVVEDGQAWLESQMRAGIGSSFYNLLGSDKGGVLYERMARDLGSMAAASEKLRVSGIPGLRYLDQVSRDAAEGTRNVVMFPGTESLIKITGRK